MKIAACLICRNSAEVIEETLGYIRAHVDEINVYDTGSTDSTVEILEAMNSYTSRVCENSHIQVGNFSGDVTCECGLPMVEGPKPCPVRVERGKDMPVFEDGSLADFSWARTRSFEMCSDDVEWIIWLDDDDIVVGAHNLWTLAGTAHPACDGFIVLYEYAHTEQGIVTCTLWRERLVRRKEGWEWRNPVHEVWLPAGEDPTPPHYMQLPPDQLRYVHRRPPDRYPADRNLRIIEALLAKNESEGTEPDMRTLAYMGTELMSQGRFPEALTWLQRYLDDPRSEVGDERSQVWHKLALSIRASGGTIQSSIGAELNAWNERPDWAENTSGLTDCFALIGDWARAAFWANRTLELGPPATTLILNPMEFSLIPFLRLAQAKAMMGQHDEALAYSQQAIQLDPANELAVGLQQSIAKDAFQAKLVTSVMTLREALIRFDENWKAWELMQNVPYIISEHPQIVAARAMTHENVRHALEPAEYERWYEDEPKESTVTDDRVPDIGDDIPRAKAMLEVLQEMEKELGRKPKALDLGCNDAWLAAYLWVRGGFHVDGLELNKASYDKALERKERFGFPGKVKQGNLHDAAEVMGEKYDCVSLFEVLEHVPDMDETLSVCESLLMPEGMVLISTPNGAFNEGNIPFWDIVERKGHLRAIPVWELQAMLQARGKIDRLDLQHGNHVSFAGYRPKLRRGRIHIYGPVAMEAWNPEHIRTRGLGGSETMLCQLAVGLAKRDWDVHVFSDVDPPGMYGGALFRPSAAFDASDDCDAIVISRVPSAFDVNLSAPFRALWCHDHSYPDMNARRVESMTDIVVLSEWERQRYAELYPYAADKLTVIANGINPKLIKHGKRGFVKRKPRVIYSSSADRGLDKLLEWWPEVRRRVPDAELHVFYGWDVFDNVARQNPQLLTFKMKVFELIEAAGGEEGGVFMRGRVGQDQLYDEMCQARVWGYPSNFLETSCIGAMEARAAGLAIVTSDLAALSETVGNHGEKIAVDFDPEHKDLVVLSDDYGKEWVRLVAESLSIETEWNKRHLAALKGVAQLDIEKRLDQWERLIEEAKERKEPQNGQIVSEAA